MAAEKRPADDYNSSQMVVKKANSGNSKAVAIAGGNGALIQSAPRTSALQAPVMELTGHSGEVFCAKFDPNGNYIASGSMDRSISEFLFPAVVIVANIRLLVLWRTYGMCENYGTL